MNTTINPFELLEIKLARIESLLEQQTQASVKESPPPESPFIPVQDIFRNKYCSKPTFYSHVRSGLIPLYKFGNRSFVKQEEFFNAFKKVNIRTGEVRAGYNQMKGGARA